MAQSNEVFVLKRELTLDRYNNQHGVTSDSTVLGGGSADAAAGGLCSGPGGEGARGGSFLQVLHLLGAVFLGVADQAELHPYSLLEAGTFDLR